MMISMDRPEHMVRRNLVNRGFTPRRVADLESRVRDVCRQIVDRVAKKGECDFVRDNRSSPAADRDRGPPGRSRRGLRLVAGAGRTIS